MSGWIKLHRNIRNHWLWSERPFDKRAAWIDLLMMASHKENRFVLGNELMEVKRGEFITSELKLMERWGWSKSKVRGFLKLLEMDSMIVRKADSKKTSITIVNYSAWQDEETAEELEKNYKKTAKRLQKDTIKNVKNIKNVKEEDIYSDFEKEILRIYPGKKIKDVREKKLPKILKKYGPEEIKRAMERYALEVKGEDRKFILNESTFWNGRFINYLDENYQEAPKSSYKATKFHNFEQRTDNYTPEDLNRKVEDRARAKREEYLGRIRDEKDRDKDM